MKKHTLGFLTVAIILQTVFAINLYGEETGIHNTINILIKDQKFDEAGKTAREYIEKHPDDAEGHCSLACVFRNRALKSGMKFDSAAAGIKEGESGSFEITKDNISNIMGQTSFYDREEYKKAEELYFKLISTHPGYRNAYYNLLNDYVKMGEFDNYFKVIHLYIHNLKDEKDSLPPLQNFFSKLYKDKYYDQGLKLLSLMVENYPDAIEAKSDMGAIYVQRGEIDKAKTIFGEVSKFLPKDTINLKNYYLTLLLTKDFTNARNVKESLEKLEPDETHHLYDRIFLSILLKKEYQSLVAEYLRRRKLETNDTEKDFWYQTANEVSHYEKLETKESVGIFEQYMVQLQKAEYTGLALIIANIIENMQLTSNALIVQAMIYDQYKYYDQTILYLDKIKKQRETDPLIMSEYDLNWNYGRNHYYARKYDLAKDYFIANQKSNPNDAKINYFLGKCYVFLGKTNEAKKLFEINSKMNDKDQMYYINYSITELKNLEVR